MRWIVAPCCTTSGHTLTTCNGGGGSGVAWCCGRRAARPFEQVSKYQGTLQAGHAGMIVHLMQIFDLTLFPQRTNRFTRREQALIPFLHPILELVRAHAHRFVMQFFPQFAPLSSLPLILFTASLSIKLVSIDNSVHWNNTFQCHFLSIDCEVGCCHSRVVEVRLCFLPSCKIKQFNAVRKSANVNSNHK